MALTPPQAYDACATLLASAGTSLDGYMKHLGILVDGRPSQRLLKVTELAEYLGVERTTIYRCGLLEKLTPVHLASCTLYDIHEVDAWIAERKAAPSLPSHPDEQA